ncbi:hypothetical protein [Microvirga massiliensis]|uniref:hypothetical protein n=1 Tax=Microvirga massiliensis TaxID=1033741 RepID=UPI00062B899C|nr:hypothetical protein [Microvirga massiliensis]
MGVTVKSITAKWSKWEISWPWWKYRTSTIQLPVTYEIELAEGSSWSDCVVGQEKKGSLRFGKNPSQNDVFSDWTKDAPPGENLWWDGAKFGSAGFGEKNWFGNGATFKDAPGFHDAPESWGSLYYGDAKGGADYFGFRFFIKDKKTMTTLGQIEWYMRIDVAVPGNGGSWWSYEAPPP